MQYNLPQKKKCALWDYPQELFTGGCRPTTTLRETDSKFAAE